MGESDLGTVKAMLDKAGVRWGEEQRDGGAPGLVLTVEAYEGPKNLGYMGFVACFYFNEDESLDAIGAWE